MPAPLIAADAPDVVDRVVSTLEAGGAVVLPTDTVYGLAALPGDAGATERLFALKGRAPSVPIAVLCATPDQALALADDRDGRGRRLASLWPGPLTLVLPRRQGLALHLGEPEATVGLRCPDHDLLRAVAERVGPIATSSANRHGQLTAATAAEAAASLGDGVALAVDAGPCTGEPSTVVDLSVAPWVIRRAGPVKPDEVERALA